jgi:hypothetical protein
MNKHVQLVKKWLEDKDSVSLEELKANKEGAYAAKGAYAAYYAAFGAAACAYACAAYYDYDAADDAAYWIKRFEELTK